MRWSFWVLHIIINSLQWNYQLVETPIIMSESKLHMHTGFKYGHTIGFQVLHCVTVGYAGYQDVRRLGEDLKEGMEQIVLQQRVNGCSVTLQIEQTTEWHKLYLNQDLRTYRVLWAVLPDFGGTSLIRIQKDSVSLGGLQNKMAQSGGTDSRLLFTFLEAGKFCTLGFL